MEAASPHAAGTNHALTMALDIAARQRKDHKTGPDSWSASQMSRDRRRERGQARRARRAMRSEEAPDRKTLNHARLGRAKPAGARMRAYQAELRRVLTGVKLKALLTECAEMKLVAGTPGLTTVWQLANASNEKIHGIGGLGPARRRKLRAYLTNKGISVKWEA
jgi:hypothetical protein